MTEQGRIWDPLRRKEVALTPEEEVRQWFIGVLHEEMGVPLHMMRSEVQMQFGAGKIWRADIVVYDRRAEPLAVVECKRPEIRLGREAVDQAVRYNHVLQVQYILITNGRRTLAFRKGAEGFAGMEGLPDWEEMLRSRERNSAGPVPIKI